MDIDEDSARISFPPPLIYFGLLILGVMLNQYLPVSVNFGLAGKYVGGGLFLAGIVCVLKASNNFDRAGTNKKPWKTTSAIVDTGIYAHSRNPMYLGMTLIFLGIAVFYSDLGALILLPVAIFIIHTQVIAREEKYLDRKFGDEYRQYKARVRRWI